MKKLLIAILVSLGSFSMVSAEIGVNVGVSLSVGEYQASGFEIEDDETSGKQKEEMVGALGSFFIEKELSFLPWHLKRITVGYDKVLHKVATGTHDTHRTDQKGGSIADAGGTQKVSADIDNISTVYATLRLTDWLYLKTGSMSMDVITTESLHTGSTYPNASLDGDMVGIGFVHTSDSGLFFRAEYSESSIDGVKLTSSNTANSVTLDGVDSENATLSIGKAF